jgi:hypothetical protein
MGAAPAKKKTDHFLFPRCFLSLSRPQAALYAPRLVAPQRCPENPRHNARNTSAPVPKPTTFLGPNGFSSRFPELFSPAFSRTNVKG